MQSVTNTAEKGSFFFFVLQSTLEPPQLHISRHVWLVDAHNGAAY
jgi:hypothetical protein